MHICSHNKGCLHCHDAKDRLPVMCQDISLLWSILNCSSWLTCITSSHCILVLSQLGCTLGLAEDSISISCHLTQWIEGMGSLHSLIWLVCLQVCDRERVRSPSGWQGASCQSNSTTLRGDDGSYSTMSGFKAGITAHSCLNQLCMEANPTPPPLGNQKCSSSPWSACLTYCEPPLLQIGSAVG